MALGGLLAALMPAGRLAAQQTINVRGYLFLLTLPDSGDGIRAAAGIVLGPKPVTDTIRLDLIGMTVDSVTGGTGIDIRVPVAFQHDGRVLRIVPRRAVTRLGVYYHGTPQDGLIIRTNARGKRCVFADNWPERGRFWLPIVDHPSDKASVHFSVTVPTGWQVVGNGSGSGHQIDPQGSVTWNWDERHPIPTYTMVIGAGQFTVSHHRPVINGRDTIPVEVWTYPEDSAYADSVPFRHATEIVQTLQEIIGPFPYEKLAHVQSSTRFGGMENSSAIFYAEKPYLERRMEEGVVRHETAHQWFGDAVTERDWHHLWLSEGFASYFDLVAGAALHGDSVLTAGMRSYGESYIRSDVVARPIIDTAEHDPLKLLNANNYQKGAWVLHMLRGLVGDSAFFAGIREYYRRYRDSTALSEDFQRVMENAGGRPLDWFFQQWLRQPGYPRLDVAWRFDSTTHQVRLDVSQVQSATGGAFRSRLTIDVRDAAGAAVNRTVSVEGRRSVAIVDVPPSFTPAEVRIDPDGKLLLRATVTRTDGKAGNH